MAIERMNYFKGEFLHAEDFQCEQKYHLDMRRRHNQYLHTSGIVDGLQVTAGAGKVTIAKGMAIDRNGKEIILEGPKDVTISSVGVIGIKHKEEEDPASDNEDTTFPGKKRIKESYELIFSQDPDAIVLAKVINASPVTLDPAFKPQYSGPAVMGDLVIQGNLTVQGETTVVKTKRMRGNVELGDEDTDIVTLKGVLKTGHSSGKLKINSYVDITGSLTVPAIGELFFQDNGQIRSLDNNHRILFRRTENKLELREYGDIIFSPGATTGAETAKVIMASNGFTKALGLSVNDATNSGVGRGLWLWSPTDSNHVIYSANPSGKSPADKTPATGYFGNTHRLRLRTARGQGFLFENDAETALVDIDADDGRLWAKGGIYAGNSDIYFTKTDHNHTGIGNAAGYAAIENAANYNALMILGRAGTPKGRTVKLWDYLQVNGELDVTGKIICPMWRVTQIFNARQGPLPLSSQFTTGGGTLLIFASGSGWSDSSGNIGMVIQIDRNTIGTARTFTNEGGSHKTFTTNALVQGNVQAGSHTITLAAGVINTRTDSNDWFFVTILELPF